MCYAQERRQSSLFDHLVGYCIDEAGWVVGAAKLRQIFRGVGLAHCPNDRLDAADCRADGFKGGEAGIGKGLGFLVPKMDSKATLLD